MQVTTPCSSLAPARCRRPAGCLPYPDRADAALPALRVDCCGSSRSACSLRIPIHSACFRAEFACCVLNRKIKGLPSGGDRERAGVIDTQLSVSSKVPHVILRLD